MDLELNRDILHASVDDFMDSIESKDYNEAMEIRYRMLELLDDMRNLQKSEVCN